LYSKRSIIIKKGIQGILYLDKVPKFAVEAPTPIAKTMAKIKHINISGTLTIVLNGWLSPLFINRLMVNNPNASASIADNIAATDFISHTKGR
jgi:hypothetical protein